MVEVLGLNRESQVGAAPIANFGFKGTPNQGIGQ